MSVGVKFTRVKSSNIKAIGYAEGTGLFVDFLNGRRYCYPDVTAETFDNLIAETNRPDGSIGRKFNQLVKAANERFEEVQL